MRLVASMILAAFIDLLILDLGLFIFDVVSDLINGANFIKSGNPFWGSVVIAAIFLPTTFLLAMLAVVYFFNILNWRQRLWAILLMPLFAPLAIALATPAYILYVVFVFARRVKDPSYVSNHLDKLLEPSLVWKGKSQFAQPADLLKVFEAILEANIQAIIGTQILKCLQCSLKS